MAIFRRTEAPKELALPEQTSEEVLRYYLGIPTFIPEPKAVYTSDTFASEQTVRPTKSVETSSRLFSKEAITGIAAIAVISALSPVVGMASPAHAEETTDFKPKAVNPNVQTKITPEVPVAAESHVNIAPVVAVAPEVKTETPQPSGRIVPALPSKESSAENTSIAPIVGTAPQDQTVASPITISKEKPVTPTESIAPIVAKPNVDAGVQKQPVKISTPDTVQAELAKEPVMPVKAPSQEVAPLPELDREHARDEDIKNYKVLKEIYRAVRSDGDISRAASFMLENYTDQTKQTVSYDKNGKKVIAVANADLVTNIQGLIKGFQGHADAHYTINARMTLAVLLATAKNQDVLASEQAQAIIAQIKRPEDPYQAKLVDQYAIKAKEALEANDNALLKGVNEDQRSTYKAVYGYALLATLSDEQQQAEIQAMKDADARAAADEAAKEAAKKAAEAQPQSPEGSAEAEAIQNLINRQGDGPEKRTFMVMQYLMQKTDLSVAQIGGIIGNMLVESASTMDPTIKQFDDGPGRGMVQWEAGRFDDLQAFAAERGTTWDDFYTQLDFLLHELPGRQNTLEVIKSKATQVEAAEAFMILFETPYTVVKAYRTGYWGDVESEAADRSSRADKYVAAFNSEVGAVNAAREAAAKQAAEAAEKAKQEREKLGPSFDQVVNLASDFFNNKFQYLKGEFEGKDDSIQCTSFVSYFMQRYVSERTRRPHGFDFAQNAANAEVNNYSIKDGSAITPFTIFSLSDGGPGHTGMIMSVEQDGSIIVAEANVKKYIKDADGMLDFKSFGDKEVENTNIGQVNIEHWSSLEAWKQHWASWGYTDPTFASPNDVKAISDNFAKGSR